MKQRPVPAHLIVARAFIGDHGVLPALLTTDLDRLKAINADGVAIYELVGGLRVHGFARLQKLYADAAGPARRTGEVMALVPPDDEIRKVLARGETVNDLHDAIVRAHPLAKMKTDPDSKGRNRRLLDLLKEACRRIEHEHKL